MQKSIAPPSAVRTGVWVGIGAIAMSFAAYTSAMVVRQGTIPEWQHFRLPPILYWNTLVLVASSVTLELARRRIGGPFDRLAQNASSSAARARESATVSLIGLESLWPNCMMTKSPGLSMAFTPGQRSR